MVVVSVAFALQAVYKPFTSSALNRMELFSLGVSWLVFAGSNLLYLPQVFDSVRVFSSVLIAGLLVIFTLFSVFTIAKHFWLENKGEVTEVVHKIKKRVSRSGQIEMTERASASDASDFET